MEQDMHYPTISVGVPTYNGGEGIMKALTSIWRQNYPNVEIIISDNCSTDNTESFVRGLCEKHPEIRYYRQSENIGIHNNFNFVLAKATGDFFMWLSDDDEIEPDLFYRYVDFMEKNPDYSIVTGQIRYWNNSVFSHLESINLEQDSPEKRMVQYYLTVRWGGVYHGLMRTAQVQNLPSRKVYGYDYHLVASLAFLGKVKTFDFVGYNKYFGGFSQNWSKYALMMGEKKWVGKFPFIKIAIDASKEIKMSPIFRRQSAFGKVWLRASVFSAVILNYYPMLYTEVLWAKIKKFTLGERLKEASSYSQ